MHIQTNRNTFELFEYEYLEELPRYEVDMKFEESLVGLSHVFLSKKIAIKNYKRVRDVLEIEIEDFSGLDFRKFCFFC